ncbi:DMT family transporter [Sulfobacillus harzensis]|uniref:DMT family transporter n=1 Tax=Sulfobacillus harzensis TaxID=2729629 RepID=A0A7Y0Q104_9FIRM|nr:DMT family transporter [Sulfobacillus harzensis]NMP21588.1 DMT family transporter [Sulfobacillus harzensis]
MMATSLGLFFTVLWSSAAIATKFGLQAAPPLWLATMRFLIAGGLLFLYVYVIRRQSRWPRRREWGQLGLLGLLNTTVYLGATFWALHAVSAGLFNLFVTINPFVVAILASLVLKRPIVRREWIGMLVAGTGLLVATGPAVAHGSATLPGIAVLVVGMLSMAMGSVYFTTVRWELPSIAIHTWQISIGGILLVPITYLMERHAGPLTVGPALIGSLAWLVLVISIGTMLLWFFLLRQDVMRANNWLFLTPVFGYGLAAVFLHERITTGDLVATIFVMTGLWLSGNITGPTRR